MIWYYEKLAEDDDSVIYAYRPNKKDAEPGEIMYAKKKNDDPVILKAAPGDNDFAASWASGHFLKVVKDGFPDKRMVMIG